jgi:RNA polymerase sigma-70 factor (ECF subfamily)
MARYAAGELEAFEELYRRHESRVYGFCLRYLVDPDAAADAFQEVFRRVVDARDTYEPRGRFLSWLYTIARRVCADRTRETRRVESLASLEVGDLSTEAVRHPEERLADEDELGRLLGSLPAEQREALILSKYHGFSYREIAEIVGSSEAAVKQKVYRALMSLRGRK